MVKAYTGVARGRRTNLGPRGKGGRAVLAWVALFSGDRARGGQSYHCISNSTNSLCIHLVVLIYIFKITCRNCQSLSNTVSVRAVSTNRGRRRPLAVSGGRVIYSEKLLKTLN